MAKDVLITPASGLIQFKDNGGLVNAVVQLDDSGNLNITHPGGNLNLGNPGTPVYIGDGVNTVDVIFEQNGSVRALAGKTLTLGQSNSSIAVASQITSNVTINGRVNVSNTIASTSNLTGALLVSGGVGIRGNVFADSITLPPNPTGTSYGAQTYPQFYIGGVIADNDAWKIYAEAPTTNEGRLVFQVEDDITETFVWRAHNFYAVGGTKDLATLNTSIFSVSSNVANFRIRNTTGSTSTSSGAAIIDGGLGVAGNVYSGGVYDTGVNIIGFAGRAFNHANAAFTSANLINGIDTTQNNSITAAFLAANSAATLSAATDLTQNNSITAAFLAANSAATLSAATDLTQNNSITAAFTRANNSISANAGGTITGDLVVTGNFTVSGATTYANTINVQLGDNIITLNAELPTSVTPSENAGFEINRGNTLANASLLWVESAGKWQANSGAATGAYFIGSESNGVYANGAFIQANAAFTTANQSLAVNLTQNNSITAAFTQANTAVANAGGASIYANGAFAAANTASIYANGAFAAANSASIYANGAFAKANTDFTNIAISAADYGSASSVASFKLEANGRISTANSTAIAISAAAITSGTLGVARGGTGATTFTTNGVLLGQGTSAVSTASSSTEGHVLTINNAGVPTFSHLQGGTF